MLLALFNIADLLLRVLSWLVIGQVVLSWLVAFNVINTSSEGVRRFLQGLERFLDPLYRPIRKIMPDFGGLDLSPVVLLIAISIIRMLLAGLASDVAV
ncbi:YggT family protein [Sphingomonas sp. GCM10030256]|uniref:YggT family protein n=1 Tax=Sphingomonas sp. GCM10030256 TaxID=3273427 RepID=UPI00360CDD18